MKTLLKTIAVSAIIAGIGSAGVISSAQAAPKWSGVSIHSDIFKGD